MAFDWKSLVKTVAPVLGTALGGPIGGMATRAIAGALLGDEEASESQIAAVLQGASPETMLKLKEADLQFETRMKELEIDVYRLDTEDRASARQREERVGGWSNPVLATVVIAGFFAVAWAVIFADAGSDPATAVLVGTVVGYVSAKADQVVSYYFGSSSGSKDKTKALAESLKK